MNIIMLLQQPLYVKRDHCTALQAVQRSRHYSIQFVSMWGAEIETSSLYMGLQSCVMLLTSGVPALLANV